MSFVFHLPADSKNLKSGSWDLAVSKAPLADFISRRWPETFSYMMIEQSFSCVFSGGGGKEVIVEGICGWNTLLLKVAGNTLGHLPDRERVPMSTTPIIHMALPLYRHSTMLSSLVCSSSMISTFRTKSHFIVAWQIPSRRRLFSIVHVLHYAGVRAQTAIF